MFTHHSERWSTCGRALIAVCWLAGAATAEAAILGGGGTRATDCLGVFSTAANPPGGRPNIRCTDGDPACDADMTVNGQCVFPVAVCANSTFDSRCTINGVDRIEIAHSADNGDPKFDPAFQALQSQVDDLDLPSTEADECSSATNIVVHLQGPFPGGTCRAGRKKLQMTTESTFLAGNKIDRDALRLTCVPAAGCSPTTFFDGTFDRIQTQILNQRCALSGCHDSESQTANLLLEVGSSYNQTVNVDPLNGVAFGLGWKRITVLSPTMGDPATSYLFHKVTGDLSPGLGDRMPLNRKPLEGFLRDILELWIEAGAPQTGWVPGTDH